MCDKRLCDLLKTTSIVVRGDEVDQSISDNLHTLVHWIQSLQQLNCTSSSSEASKAVEPRFSLNAVGNVLQACLRLALVYMEHSAVQERDTECLELACLLEALFPTHEYKNKKFSQEDGEKLMKSLPGGGAVEGGYPNLTSAVLGCVETLLGFSSLKPSEIISPEKTRTLRNTIVSHMSKYVGIATQNDGDITERMERELECGVQLLTWVNDVILPSIRRLLVGADTDVRIKEVIEVERSIILKTENNPFLSCVSQLTEKTWNSFSSLEAMDGKVANLLEVALAEIINFVGGLPAQTMCRDYTIAQWVAKTLSCKDYATFVTLVVEIIDTVTRSEGTPESIKHRAKIVRWFMLIKERHRASQPGFAIDKDELMTMMWTFIKNELFPEQKSHIEAAEKLRMEILSEHCNPLFVLQTIHSVMPDQGMRQEVGLIISLYKFSCGEDTSIKKPIAGVFHFTSELLPSPYKEWLPLLGDLIQSVSDDSPVNSVVMGNLEAVLLKTVQGTPDAIPAKIVLPLAKSVLTRSSFDVEVWINGLPCDTEEHKMFLLAVYDLCNPFISGNNAMLTTGLRHAVQRVMKCCSDVWVTLVDVVLSLILNGKLTLEGRAGELLNGILNDTLSGEEMMAAVGEMSGGPLSSLISKGTDGLRDVESIIAELNTFDPALREVQPLLRAGIQAGKGNNVSSSEVVESILRCSKVSSVALEILPSLKEIMSKEKNSHDNYSWMDRVLPHLPEDIPEYKALRKGAEGIKKKIAPRDMARECQAALSASSAETPFSRLCSIYMGSDEKQSVRNKMAAFIPQLLPRESTARHLLCEAYNVKQEGTEQNSISPRLQEALERFQSNEKSSYKCALDIVVAGQTSTQMGLLDKLC